MQGAGVGGVRVPNSVIQHITQQIGSRSFPVMPKIAVMIENARVADERKRTNEMPKTPKLPAYKPPKRYSVGTNVRVRNPGIDGVVTQMDDERTIMSEYWHTVMTKYGEKREPGCNLERINAPISNTRPMHSKIADNIHFHGDNNVVTQSGNVHIQQHKVNDFNELATELSSFRAALKAQPSTLESDEAIGLLAAAEKAAHEKDEKKVNQYLGQITKGSWELIKASVPQIATQAALHFLKARGLV